MNTICNINTNNMCINRVKRYIDVLSHEEHLDKFDDLINVMKWCVENKTIDFDYKTLTIHFTYKNKMHINIPSIYTSIDYFITLQNELRDLEIKLAKSNCVEYNHIDICRINNKSYRYRIPVTESFNININHRSSDDIIVPHYTKYFDDKYSISIRIFKNNTVVFNDIMKNLNCHRLSCDRNSLLIVKDFLPTALKELYIFRGYCCYDNNPICIQELKNYDIPNIEHLIIGLYKITINVDELTVFKKLTKITIDETNTVIISKETSNQIDVVYVPSSYFIRIHTLFGVE